MKKAFLTLAIMVILSPLGLLAHGSAWGEWTAVELKQKLGFAPKGLVALESIWRSPMAGYSVPGLTGGAGRAAGYVFSAVLGIGLIYGIFRLFGRFLVDPEDGERD